MSRLETGRQPLNDVTVMRHLAAIFHISASQFGLADPIPANHRLGVTAGTLRSGRRERGGDETVQRRDLLASLAALPLAVGTPASIDQAVDHTRRLAAALDDLLFGATDRLPPSLDPTPVQLRRLIASVKADFQASRYDNLATQLPRLIRLVEVASTEPHIIAEAYNTALQVLLKLETPDTGWIAADRAMKAARSSGDPLLVASVTRNLVSLCRGAKRYDRAQSLALAAADNLNLSSPQPDPTHVSLYGMLLCNAGYAAAQAGDRSRATELLDLADRAAELLGGDRNEHWTAFGPANVTLHRISASYALGDSGTAIEHARRIAPGTLHLPERQSRYWIDVARAYDQWGKPDSCLRAITIAESLAPQEIRSRPVVRKLVLRLLSSPSSRSTTELNALASRVGATS